MYQFNLAACQFPIEFSLNPFAYLYSNRFFSVYITIFLFSFGRYAGNAKRDDDDYTFNEVKISLNRKMIIIFCLHLLYFYSLQKSCEIPYKYLFFALSQEFLLVLLSVIFFKRLYVSFNMVQSVESYITFFIIIIWIIGSKKIFFLSFDGKCKELDNEEKCAQFGEIILKRSQINVAVCQVVAFHVWVHVRTILFKKLLLKIARKYLRDHEPLLALKLVFVVLQQQCYFDWLELPLARNIRVTDYHKRVANWVYYNYCYLYVGYN